MSPSLFLVFFLLLSLPPFIPIFPSPLHFSLILAWSPSVCASVCVRERPDSPLNWVVLIREQTFYFGDASAKMHCIKRAEGMLSCRWRGCVCMCYHPRSRVLCVCVFVFGQREKKTNLVMERSSGWWKRGHVLRFQETNKNVVFISKMWTRSIMSNYLGLAVNVCGCIPICNSI